MDHSLALDVHPQVLYRNSIPFAIGLSVTMRDAPAVAPTSRAVNVSTIRLYCRVRFVRNLI